MCYPWRETVGPDVLKRLKLGLLRSAEALGGGRLLLNSGWRKQRLLILCYHGVSLGDEHLWNPQLYMSAEFFRRRLEILRSRKCAVLPLNQALERLRSATLPERSVAITFDDGLSDFLRRALPELNRFGFPATLYLTTYYSRFQRPVFDVMLSYLLWKGRGGELAVAEIARDRLALDDAGRAFGWAALQSYVRSKGFSAVQKDALLASLAARLHIDYEELRRERILHLLTEEEVIRVTAAGIDVQLHTHRHRTPRDRDLFLKELEDNRAAIEKMLPDAKGSLRHFCYPSGDYFPEALPWLTRAGICSAVTCEPGLATRDNPPLLLPRLVDHMGLSEIEFGAWISGVATWLPLRPAGAGAPGGDGGP
jgi:peptidoglycan/xylan/chitin deacetylase (PgdA/CDA1 family)